MRVSSKAINVDLAHTLRESVKSTSDSPIKMMYLTSYGFITGIPKVPTSQSENSKDFLKESLSKSSELDLNVLMLLKEELVAQSDEKLEIIGDGSFIVLSEAKIYHNSLDAHVISLGTFILHVADIIGFTYVPVDSGL